MPTPLQCCWSSVLFWCTLPWWRRVSLTATTMPSGKDNKKNQKTTANEWFDPMTWKQGDEKCFCCWIVIDLSPGERWGSSTHSGKQSKQGCVSLNSCFSLHGPKTLCLCFQTTWPHALLTLCQLSEEVCLYMGADWLGASVSLRMVVGQLYSYYLCK